MSGISEETFQHIAKLAKLSYPKEAAGKANAKFEEILNMVDQLNEVDTEGVPVMTSGIALKNVMRGDDPVPGMDRDELLKNTPTKEAGQIHVPATFDESEDA